LVNWYKSIDKARYLYPEYLVPSHTRPLKGKDSIFLGFATEAQILEEAQKYFENKKFRESLYLSDILLQSNSENKKAKALHVDTLIALGSSDKNAYSRHYYLTKPRRYLEIS